MTLPAIPCPSCNVRAPLDVWLPHAAARDAMLALANLHPSQSRLAMTALRYVGLFAPARQEMRWDRIATVLADLQALISFGQVEWEHQRFAAPLDYWIAAMDSMIADPRIERPLKNHNYLRAIVAGMGRKAAAGAERAENDRRAGNTPVGGLPPSSPPLQPSPLKGEGEKPRASRDTIAAALAAAKSITQN